MLKHVQLQPLISQLHLCCVIPSCKYSTTSVHVLYAFYMCQGSWKMGQPETRSRVWAHSSFSASLAVNFIFTQTQIHVLAVRLSFPSDSLKIPFPAGICHCVLLLTLVTTKSLKPWPSESNSKTQTAWKKKQKNKTRQILEKDALDFLLKKGACLIFSAIHCAPNLVVHECVQQR